MRRTLSLYEHRNPISPFVLLEQPTEIVPHSPVMPFPPAPFREYPRIGGHSFLKVPRFVR